MESLKAQPGMNSEACCHPANKQPEPTWVLLGAAALAPPARLGTGEAGQALSSHPQCSTLGTLFRENTFTGPRHGFQGWQVCCSPALWSREVPGIRGVR